ncbi:hypothetical protein FRC03_007077 [Tulasnella sp. 419]|nr:hypothetical protein FRC03_007077 [Tulasnella sp. 419]
MDQFGVTEVSGCTGAKANLATPYRPILFWVFSQELKQASLTFCQPSIRILDVLVRADLQTKLLVNVTLIGDYKAANNVTGMPQNGLAFNGIAFDIENSDPFVQARAASTRSGLPHAVYRTAEQHPGGIVKLMQTPNAIAELTDKVYLQFLSIVAKSTYFVAATNMINSQVDSSELRLYVYPTAAHSFTAALLLVAILGTCVHISHARARRNVYISLDPGTIGATISMSSHSTFISRLDAGYDEEDISKALNGMKFGISPRTWQISPRGEDGLDQVAAVQLPGSPSGRGKEVKDV